MKQCQDPEHLGCDMIGELEVHVVGPKVRAYVWIWDSKAGVLVTPDVKPLLGLLTRTMSPGKRRRSPGKEGSP